MTHSDKAITIKRGGNNLHLAFPLNESSTDDYVITFVETESLHKKNHRITGSEAYFTFDDIIGHSPVMQNALSLARIAASNVATVLLIGESGTGKELFAQAIHNGSCRKDGPFMALNCATLPKNLIESELFGYENGTVTGTGKEGSAGKFELANGGTIFLDEIGGMPLDVQASLLHVLENRVVRRIGSSKPIKIDVRIIASSNKNLTEASKSNTFLEALHNRLNVFNINIPPLRERATDIRPLAEYFLNKYANVGQKSLHGLTKEAYQSLERHPWQGNVRELENTIKRAVYTTRGILIEPDCLQIQPSPAAAKVKSYGLQQNTPKKKRRKCRENVVVGRNPALASAFKAGHAVDAVEKAIVMAKGNMGNAASLLGVSRRTLYRKMEAINIKPAVLRKTAGNTHGNSN